jgi:hypothetical protein
MACPHVVEVATCDFKFELTNCDLKSDTGGTNQAVTIFDHMGRT